MKLSIWKSVNKIYKTKEENNQEIWKPMSGFEGYYLMSNNGKVLRIKDEHFIKPNRNHILRLYIHPKQSNVAYYHSKLFETFEIDFDPQLDTILNRSEYSLNQIEIEYFDFTKICNTCNRCKSLDYFHNRVKGRFGRSERCTFCSFSTGKKYFKDNKQRILTKNKRNYNKDKSTHLQRTKNWAKLNKYRRLFLSRKLQELPKHRALANARVRRRELLKNKSYRLFPSDWAKVQSFYLEAKRLSLETKIKHEVDHIIPIKGVNVCGLHVSWNLQILTKSESIKKGNKF